MRTTLDVDDRVLAAARRLVRLLLNPVVTGRTVTGPQAIAGLQRLVAGVGFEPT